MDQCLTLRIRPCNQIVNRRPIGRYHYGHLGDLSSSIPDQDLNVYRVFGTKVDRYVYPCLIEVIHKCGMHVAHRTILTYVADVIVLAKKNKKFRCSDMISYNGLLTNMEDR